MSLPSTADVVIVGAGPAGLATALVLAANKVSFVVVDALAVGQNESRAAVVHAYTLERLDTVGVADAIVAEGFKMNEIAILDDHESAIAKLPLNEQLEGKTKYPFSILIAQCHVERILTARLTELGCAIHRQKRVTGIQTTDDGIAVTFEAGEVLKAKYVVGADGSKSVIRASAGIPFLDPRSGQPSVSKDTDQQVVLADMLVQKPLPSAIQDNTPWAAVNYKGLCLMIPVPSGGEPTPPDMAAFRTAVVLPQGSTPPHAPNAEYMQDLLVQYGPGHNTGQTIKVTKVTASSRYRVRSGLAQQYFKRLGESGWVFLAGDAAHIHSPAGGQGMNLGLTDGVQLGLAIIEGTPEAFAQYEKKRRPAASEVIALAENMTNLATSWWNQLPFALQVRATLVRLLLMIPGAKSTIIWRLSGLVYRNY